MYLPWAYDFSMLTNFIVYILSGIYGTGIWTSPLLAGYTFVDILKVTMYGGSVFTMIVAVKNVIDVWRANTCKQPNLIESFRPWGMKIKKKISARMSNFNFSSTIAQYLCNHIMAV